jgi:2Fe-2S ferredoxin
MAEQDVEITIIDRGGIEHKVQAPTDMNMNLMEVIRSFELAQEGTIGVCGGMAMCASCQCYIKSNHDLPAMEIDEEAMLSEAFYVKDNSRLGCLIPISHDLKNLVAQIAPES